MELELFRQTQRKWDCNQDQQAGKTLSPNELSHTHAHWQVISMAFNWPVTIKLRDNFCTLLLALQYKFILQYSCICSTIQSTSKWVCSLGTNPQLCMQLDPLYYYDYYSKCFLSSTFLSINVITTGCVQVEAEVRKLGIWSAFQRNQYDRIVNDFQTILINFSAATSPLCLPHKHWTTRKIKGSETRWHWWKPRRIQPVQQGGPCRKKFS